MQDINSVESKIRREERWTISYDKLPIFLNKIKDITKQNIVAHEYNDTIYFDNKKLETPLDISLKARRYSCNIFNGRINLNDNWIFELKQGYEDTKLCLKQKQRQNLTMKEILTMLASPDILDRYHFSLPLLPYGADSYKRLHYDIKNQEGFRLTIDSDIQYFLFNTKTKASLLGKEDCVRIEIKIPEDKMNTPELKQIHDVLSKLKAIPTISKKDAMHNLIAKYLKGQTNKRTPEFDTEIEAKLILSKQNQYLFSRIYDDFQQGVFKDFKILKKFPYVIEKGKLHQYTTDKGDPIRISVRENINRMKRKSNEEVIKDEYNLNCILKRTETRERYDKNNSNVLSKILYRKRKYFIVDNIRNKNSYCILIDRCTYNGEELFQIEVEGLSQSSDRVREKEIIKDISYITYNLTKRYPDLKPTTITKDEWVRSIR